MLYMVNDELLETLTRIGEYTTSGGGKLRIDNLSFGKYYFVQTIAPKGYSVTNCAVSFSLTETDANRSVVFPED
ncbi:MAG TPA: hypothetical protein DCW47_06730 [Lachnospiraceae bacterium]|nr:hypothetical protein [Lachnospiraceae bacterium]